MTRSARLLPYLLFLVACAGVLLLHGCATQPPLPSAPQLPGFLHGLLHGFLILFSFIGSLFTDVRIYAYPNAGGWYDFGFLLGAMMFLGGGGGAGAHRRRR
ncbi:MAG TPA: hypothetical protein VFX89_06870 [Gammaproteobacteria bacterium]|nr:hypothetical protein [Gammaproteobacteria bacterium]